jgi:ABC-type lipoprotein export system ATPase subunit
MLKKAIKELINIVPKRNLIHISVLTALIACASLMDIFVVYYFQLVSISNLSAKAITTLIFLIFARGAIGIVLNHLQSKAVFRVYGDLVFRRFNDAIDSDDHADAAKDLNYITIESLNVVLTVLLPLSVFLAAIAQFLVLLLGIWFQLEGQYIWAGLIIAAVYLMYAVPMQRQLKFLGGRRRWADDLRSDFISNALRSSYDIRFFPRRDSVLAQYIRRPSYDIERALAMKWSNATSQKNILELSALAGSLVWFFIFTPDINSLSSLAASAYLLYRIAPLIGILSGSYQSMGYGITSFQRAGDSSRAGPNKRTRNQPDSQVLKTLERSMLSRNGIFAITGESGIGKTTLLRTLAERASSSGRKVAFLGQLPLIFSGSLEENIGVPLEDPALSGYLHLIPEFLKGRDDMSKGSVSAGESLRIALLRQFSAQPDVLLLDEPLACLDANNREIVCESINEYSRSHLVYIVTHDIPKNLAVTDVIQLRSS